MKPGVTLAALGFHGPDTFRAQLVEDMRELDVVKKKPGL